MTDHTALRHRPAIQTNLEAHFDRAARRGERPAIDAATNDLVAAAAFLELKLGPVKARGLLIATADAVCGSTSQN